MHVGAIRAAVRVVRPLPFVAAAAVLMVPVLPSVLGVHELIHARGGEAFVRPVGLVRRELGTAGLAVPRWFELLLNDDFLSRLHVHTLAERVALCV